MPTQPDVEFLLSPEQHQLFLPLVRRQVTSRCGLLLATIAPFLTDGQQRLRFQAVFVTHPDANKILKIIKNHGYSQTQDSDQADPSAKTH
jgi:hypothetical protein